MGVLIKGLHIEEIQIGMDAEHEQTGPDRSEPVQEEPKQEEPKQEEPKQEEPKKAETKAKPKATKKTQPIDKGKIGALRKAGWAIAEIADEMKCSNATVYKVLNELKEEGK